MYWYFNCTSIHVLVLQLYKYTCTDIATVQVYMYWYCNCTSIHVLVLQLYKCICIANVLESSLFLILFLNNEEILEIKFIVKRF